MKNLSCNNPKSCNHRHAIFLHQLHNAQTHGHSRLETPWHLQSFAPSSSQQMYQSISTFLSPVSPPCSQNSPLCSIQFEFGTLNSPRWLLPYQVLSGSNVGTVSQLVSAPGDEYQTVPPALQPVSYYPSPCLASMIGSLPFILCTQMNPNRRYYTQNPFLKT